MFYLFRNLVLLFFSLLFISAHSFWVPEEEPLTVENLIKRFNFCMNHAPNQDIFKELRYILQDSALEEFKKIYKLIFSLEEGTKKNILKEDEKADDQEESFSKNKKSSSSSSEKEAIVLGRSAEIIANFVPSLNTKITLSEEENAFKKSYLRTIIDFLYYAKNLKIQIIEIKFLNEDKANVLAYFHDKNKLTYHKRKIVLYRKSLNKKNIWKISNIIIDDKV